MIDSACRPSHQVILYIGGRRLLNDICGYGGIGRRAGFRFLCCKACGFESHYPHHVGTEILIQWVSRFLSLLFAYIS